MGSSHQQYRLNDLCIPGDVRKIYFLGMLELQHIQNIFEPSRQDLLLSEPILKIIITHFRQPCVITIAQSFSAMRPASPRRLFTIVLTHGLPNLNDTIFRLDSSVMK